MADPLADLDREARAKLELLVAALADPQAPTAVREPAQAWQVHIADSLSALELEQVAQASALADLGAGAGFPGLPLAIALPEARLDLVEANARKCEFIRRAAAAVGIPNARVIQARSEEWGASPPPAGGREAYDVVTARAVSSLAADAELASPLLRTGGVLVAWKGARVAAEEDALGAAGDELAMAPLAVAPVTPYSGSRDRHLHVVRKTGPTPAGLPRRPGVAAKRRAR